MVDSHAHIALCDPSEAELIAAAGEAGVNRILTVGLGEDSNPGVIELSAEHDSRLRFGRLASQQRGRL